MPWEIISPFITVPLAITVFPYDSSEALFSAKTGAFGTTCTASITSSGGSASSIGVSETFTATVAGEESIDSASAADGGNLGYFKKGSMISEFEEAAFDLKVGEVSGLVKTEVGYHIIYIEDRKDTFETLKDDITLVLKDDKYLNELKDMRESAKVKVILDTKSK